MIYLASQSPRRRELLAQLGVRFEVLDPRIEEVRPTGESAAGYVNRVAREKAGAGLLQVGDDPNALVLAADTEVLVDDDVLGKPADEAAALAMLARLSGRMHEVLSVVWAVRSGVEARAESRSRVWMPPTSSDVLRAYVSTGESFGKAGGYAIQGRGAALIERLEGSYSGVMGLPLFETARLLARFGAL